MLLATVCEVYALYLGSLKVFYLKHVLVSPRLNVFNVNKVQGYIQAVSGGETDLYKQTALVQMYFYSYFLIIHFCCYSCVV